MIKRRKKTPRKKLEVALDKIFSLIIRQRGHCQKCGKAEDDKLQCSHIHSRSKLSVRWDLNNAFCLCSGCHIFWWHKHPIEAAEFTKKVLGEYEYAQLNVRAQMVKKWTPDEMEQHLTVLTNVYETTYRTRE